MSKSPIHYGDSYKYGHSAQYIPMVGMYDYMSSRGGVFPKVLFTGAQGIIAQYLTKPITAVHVEKLAKRAKLHGVPFDYIGWMHIVNKHNGYLPIKIKAIPEGTLVPVNMVLMTIESTDPIVPWVPGFVETLLMKIWYPTAISTKAYYVMKLLLKYGSREWAEFAYHAFGDRACTSPESAAIAGYAHLAAGFKGTDNFDSLDYCEEFYGVPENEVAGYSVFASEHSTTTSYGRDGEKQFVYDQLLANPSRTHMSFVADSYDVYNFTDFCTNPSSSIRDLIESRPHQKLVLRPDSGKPTEVIERMLNIMFDNDVSYTTTDKGLRLFTKYSILWGDGITPLDISAILTHVTSLGYAAENFIFGSGGDLMQNVNRDTHKFAIKCSSVKVLDEYQTKEAFSTGEVYKNIDVYKDPITDKGKSSMRGRVTTYFNTVTKEYRQGLVDNYFTNEIDVLETIFVNGEVTTKHTLEHIRNVNKITAEV